MDFLQRRGHLYKWILIAFILFLGFIFSALAAFQKKIKSPIINSEYVHYSQGTVIDSLYIQEINTNLILKQNNNTFIEIQIQEELAYPSLKIFSNNNFIGQIDTKDIYFFDCKETHLNDIKIIDPIKNKIIFTTVQ